MINVYETKQGLIRVGSELLTHEEYELIIWVLNEDIRYVKYDHSMES